MPDSLLKYQQKKNVLVSTFAGNGTQGVIDGPALNAEFDWPYALICKSATDIFIMDNQQYLRKIENGLLIFLNLTKIFFKN